VTCIFASDLHGRLERYRTLLDLIAVERPDAVFLGGDLLPSGFAAAASGVDFVAEFLAPGFRSLARLLGPRAPQVFLILGNDDPRDQEAAIQAHAAAGLWHYAHNRRLQWGALTVIGYQYVPPTPFLLKDWERYDVSRQVEPGCVSPEEGWRTVPVDEHEVRSATIAADLQALAVQPLDEAVCLFHSPPYRTTLDRAALDEVTVDHVPCDVHVGSVAIRRFIESRQPLLTLHGHIHESARLTGDWRDRIGRTVCLSAAHDGPELAVVRFDPRRPERATRELR
jgi:Icc-related predicted phosphoesterase